VSPILTRPVREQLEHDRVIRLLQARYRRKYDVAINPAGEQNTSVMSGEMAIFPDLVLFSLERGRRLQGTVEVETGESVNTLEALAQWGPFSRQRAPFFLYVPPTSLETARRLCAEHNIAVAEIWTYHTALDQVRFTMVHRAPESAAKPKARAPEPTAAAKASPPRAQKPAAPAARRKQKAAAPRRPAVKNAAGSRRPSKATRGSPARRATRPAARKVAAKRR
jgi:hypothetical protein